MRFYFLVALIAIGIGFLLALGVERWDKTHGRYGDE